MRVDWAALVRPLAGQEVSGDAWVLADAEGGQLVGAIDGLGHGRDAALAAAAAAEALRRRAGPDLLAALAGCHEALRRTRGAALSLAWIDLRAQRLSWTGVGNVEGMLLRAAADGPPAERLLLHNGIVGSQLPPCRAAWLPFSPGDCLILASDGIRPGFTRHAALGEAPQALARRILEDCGRDEDDALVVVGKAVE